MASTSALGWFHYTTVSDPIHPVGAKFYISIKVLKPFDCAPFRNSGRLEFHGFRIEIKRELEIEKGQATRAYGRYENVVLTDTELRDLKAEFPDAWARYVEKLSEYMASTGRKYKSHAATIRRWIQQDRPTWTPDYSCAEGDSL